MDLREFEDDPEVQALRQAMAQREMKRRNADIVGIGETLGNAIRGPSDSPISDAVDRVLGGRGPARARQEAPSVAAEMMQQAEQPLKDWQAEFGLRKELGTRKTAQEKALQAAAEAKAQAALRTAQTEHYTQRTEAEKTKAARSVALRDPAAAENVAYRDRLATIPGLRETFGPTFDTLTLNDQKTVEDQLSLTKRAETGALAKQGLELRKQDQRLRAEDQRLRREETKQERTLKHEEKAQELELKTAEQLSKKRAEEDLLYVPGLSREGARGAIKPEEAVKLRTAIAAQEKLSGLIDRMIEIRDANATLPMQTWFGTTAAEEFDQAKLQAMLAIKDIEDMGALDTQTQEVGMKILPKATTLSADKLKTIAEGLRRSSKASVLAKARSMGYRPETTPTDAPQAATPTGPRTPTGQPYADKGMGPDGKVHYFDKDGNEVQ